MKDKTPRPRSQSFFHRFAKATSRASGHGLAFGLAFATIIIWAVAGPFFHFNETWQLTINTATTIITFLMVFLIQNSQNRDSDAILLKLDELIRSTQNAHNAMLHIEELEDEAIDELKAKYKQLAQEAIREVEAGQSDLGSPQVNKPQ